MVNRMLQHWEEGCQVWALLRYCWRSYGSVLRGLPDLKLPALPGTSGPGYLQRRRTMGLPIVEEQKGFVGLHEGERPPYSLCKWGEMFWTMAFRLKIEVSTMSSCLDAIPRAVNTAFRVNAAAPSNMLICPVFELLPRS